MLHMTNQLNLVVDESKPSGIQYLHILVESLETPQVSYLCDYQTLTHAPNRNNMGQAVNDAVRSLEYFCAIKTLCMTH